MDTPTPSNSKNAIIIGIIIVLAIIAIIIWKTQSNSTPATTPDQTTTVPTGTTTPVANDTKKYKDGTYSATGNYVSPAGAEQVDISVTLANDIVTNATFTGEATNPTSRRMQGQFAAGFKEQVVGKSIDQINLTVVNGSSLAPKGFMDALNKIKTQAAVAA